MNAKASAFKPLDAQPALARAEHIALEGETETVAHEHRKARASYTLHSAVHGLRTELSLLDEHYLDVRITRARKEPLEYSLDLRFLNSLPVRVRRIAWAWFALGAAGTLAGCVGVWFAVSAASLAYALGSSAALAGAALVVWLGMRATSEALNFSSVHGGATLVSVIGGLGSIEQGKAFFVAMIKEIAAAKAARPQSKPQWLRDEMREHHRLRELGVLSEADYEASKKRILKAHA